MGISKSTIQLFIAAALCAAPALANAQQGEYPEGEGLNCGDVYVDLECHGEKTSVELQASAFIFQGSSLTWSSTCAGGEFSDTGVLSPIFTLNSETEKGKPQSCEVLLYLDYGYGYGQTCSAPVSVGTCARDCAGVIDGGSKLDRCGVCNGDGNSCLDCNTTDTLPALLALDGSTLGQRNLILNATRLMIELSPTKETKALAEKTNALAQNYYQQTWTQIYSLPPVILSCGNTNFCTSASTAGYVEIFRSNENKLVELLERTIRQLKKLSKRPGVGKRLLEKSEDLTRITEATIATLPSTQSACS